MEDNFSLDTFVKENGQQITEDSIKTISKEVIEKKVNNFIYEDSDTPIPGQSIDNKLTNQLDNMNENIALDSLITKAAMTKAKNEANNEMKTNKLSAKERMQYKKNFIESMMYQQGESYYQKHKCMMDGKTKRNTRRHLEKEFDKGKFDKYIIQNLYHYNLNE